MNSRHLPLKPWAVIRLLINTFLYKTRIMLGLENTVHSFFLPSDAVLVSSLFGWRQRYLPWNEWLHRASLVPISNPPPTLLKSYSCQGPPICNVCFVKKVIEIFREGADSCLRFCWVCISSLSPTCDGKSWGGWNGRSPGVNQKECSEVGAAALFLTLIVFTAIKRSQSGLSLCSPHFFLSSSVIILVFKLWL